MFWGLQKLGKWSTSELCNFAFLSFLLSAKITSDMALLNCSGLITLLPSNVLAANGYKFNCQCDLVLFQTSSCSVSQTFLCVPQQQLRNHFGAWCIQQQVVPSPGLVEEVEEEKKKTGRAWGRLPTEPWKHGTQSMSGDRHSARWQNNACRGKCLLTHTLLFTDAFLT